MSAYRAQDLALRGLPQACAASDLRVRVLELINTHGDKKEDRRGLWLPWAAAIATLLAVLLLPLHQTPSGVTASGIPVLRRYASDTQQLGPNTGTATVSYRMLGSNDELVPAASATFLDGHRLRVHWSVGDVRHYRIDITTVEPALLAGTVTYVRSGSRILVYDRRSETALEASIHPSPFMSDAQLLALLKTGLSFGPAVGPAPDESINHFVATLRRQSAGLHPPGYARLVGHGRLLGRKVDIVEFGPLQRSDYITGCSFDHPGHCMHHPSGAGFARVWIDHVYPIVLRYEASDAGSDRSMTSGLHVQVVSIRYGMGPPARDLQFRPPVRTVRIPYIFANVGIASGVPFPGSPFVNPGLPTGFTSTDWLDVLDDVYQTAIPTKPPRYDRVYGRSTPSLLGGQRVASVQGPYVYIEQQVQMHGLPIELRRGVVRKAGACEVYVGRYSDGQRWLAFQARRVSVLIATNALSEDQLVGYAAHDVCGHYTR